MAWIEGIRRRIAALWAGLLGVFRAPARAELPRLPERAPQDVGPAPPVQGEVTIDVETVVEAPVRPAPPVQIVQAAPPVPAPAASEPVRPARALPVGALGPELGVLRVRQFFGRMVLAGPGAQAVDLAEWARLPVERFFLAVGAPRALVRREAPTSGGEAVRLGNAFEGFEWD